MSMRVAVVCLVGALAIASPARDSGAEIASPIHIIKPPVRCPEGTKPDANGRCRVVWGKNAAACAAGQEPDENGTCREVEWSSECFGEECSRTKRISRREVEDSEREAARQPRKAERTAAAKGEKRNKRRSDFEEDRAGKQARSKHAFLIMLKKKKMQMMKPKPPPPPHHHPPHHHPESDEEPEEEEAPEEENTPAPERLFFGDEGCGAPENGTGCEEGAEMVKGAEADDLKEWAPESSESSESSDTSSSSDSTGESDSDAGSGESEDEVLERAIKIKLMKLFRMKQRYGPALRRWLLTQLREYEDSFVS